MGCRIACLFEGEGLICPPRAPLPTCPHPRMTSEELKQIANFLFEAGMLQKTPRSGFSFLGSGAQSVAEHLNRVGYIGFVLAKMHGKADLGKVLQMCMFHDFSEARVSDLNYVHQKYTDRHEDRAIADLAAAFPFGQDLQTTVNEYEERLSIEARLTKDADNLEFLLSVKEQMDIGNARAKRWIPALIQRLLTDEAKQLVFVILGTDADEWWYASKPDAWWVNRNKPPVSAQEPPKA